MKMISALVLSFSLFAAFSAVACMEETFRLHQVSLDANGVLRRSEAREVPVSACEEDGKTTWKNVVVDQITLEIGDEVTLNAAPDVQDATIVVTVKREAQRADRQGIFSTSYTVHEKTTSGWGGGTSVKKFFVMVESNYLGDGRRSRGCGRVSAKEFTNSTVPALMN